MGRKCKKKKKIAWVLSLRSSKANRLQYFPSAFFSWWTLETLGAYYFDFAFSRGQCYFSSLNLPPFPSHFSSNSWPLGTITKSLLTDIVWFYFILWLQAVHLSLGQKSYLHVYFCKVGRECGWQMASSLLRIEQLKGPVPLMLNPVS